MENLHVDLLYLDMNSYFASVEQQVDASLRGRPVGVVTTLHEGACCIAASYEAKALGIRTGTRMRDARQMCPDITFRAARHDLYVDYHHRIKAAVETVLPIEGVHSVDEFSCRLTGADRGLERAMELAQQMRAQIYQRAGVALRCSIGLGGSRLLAKIAGELEKPEGLQWLLPVVMPDKIAHLGLTGLPGISRGVEKRLLAAGIETVQALYALDPRHARRIWRSVQGERFIRALQGEDIPDPVTRPHSLGHGQVLSPENRSLDGARLVARRLLIKAATRLRRGRCFATYMHVSVKCREAGRLSYGARINATQDTFQLLNHYREFWARLAPVHPASVAVMLGGLQSGHSHTADLFEARRGPGELTARERLCLVVDGLNQRYGSDTVVYGERPVNMTPYTGAKIAFGRVPERVEFQD